MCWLNKLTGSPAKNTCSYPGSTVLVRVGLLGQSNPLAGP